MEVGTVERCNRDGERKKRRPARGSVTRCVGPGGRPICRDHNDAWAVELSRVRPFYPSLSLSLSSHDTWRNRAVRDLSPGTQRNCIERYAIPFDLRLLFSCIPFPVLGNFLLIKVDNMEWLSTIRWNYSGTRESVSKLGRKEETVQFVGLRNDSKRS